MSTWQEKVRWQPMAGQRRFARFTIALVIAAFAVAARASAAEERDERWIGTWSASPQARANVFFDGTLREIVRVSIGGDRVRVRLSNVTGTVPLIIGGAHVARRLSGPAIEPGSDRTLSFRGSSSTIIPPGAVVVSDPVDLEVAPLSHLAISVYLPSRTAATTAHSLGLQTTYVSPPGDFTDVAVMPVASTNQSWWFLTGVEVTASGRTAAVATIGDSITDGARSTPDTNNRWPDHLAERLLASGRSVAVLNEGISGNRVVSDGAGVNAQARFDRDVLVQSGVTHVIVLEGINDSTNAAFVADRIIDGLHQMIVRAHARGLKIYGGTLTPAGSSGLREANRVAVNDWIRSSGEFDAIIDFDEITRDPLNPRFFLPAYDSGDHLHPGNVGYQAMADAIDLELFRQPRER
jgi:lysophospholipase L1-like esterase